MKRVSLPGFVAAVICFPCTVLAEEPQCDGNDRQIEACQANALDAAKTRLDGVYALVLKMFDAGAVDPASSFFSNKKERVSVAQRAWVKFMDAQCAAEATLVIPGSAVAKVEGACLLRLTHERTQFLQGLKRELQYTSKFCEKDGSLCKFQ